MSPTTPESVQAGALEIGERLQTLSGDVKVVQQKLPRPGPEPVFNLEVHAEHVYFVGEDGVLVHNSYEDIVALGLRQHLDNLPGTPYDRLHRVALSNVDLSAIDDGGIFIAELGSVLRGRAKGIVFALDDLDFGDVSRQIGKATVLNKNTTSKELLLVLNRMSEMSAAGKTVRFVRNGQSVDIVEEILNSQHFLNRSGTLDSDGVDSMLRLLKQIR